jgi:hypothetical protein
MRQATIIALGRLDSATSMLIPIPDAPAGAASQKE